MNETRWLLCRPEGGLNDVLCQVELACLYAERFGRTVIVDTDYANAVSFKDTFGRYFVTRQRRLILDIGGLRERIDALETFPAHVQGRVSHYRIARDRLGPTFPVEEESQTRITFDFERDYAQPLLVHHAAGGGMRAASALARLRLHDSLCDALLRRLAAIGRPYTAVHIRNTDYRTPYAAWLLEAKDRIAGPVFLATDDRACRNDFEAAFGPGRIQSFAALPDRPVSLHSDFDRNQAYQRNSDAILDLLMLVLARDYYFLPLAENPLRTRFSGFSLLAAKLRESRPLVADLLGRPDPLLAEALWQ